MSNHFTAACQSADGLNIVKEKYLTASIKQVVKEKRKIMKNLKSNSSYIFLSMT